MANAQIRLNPPHCPENRNHGPVRQTAKQRWSSFLDGGRRARRVLWGTPAMGVTPRKGMWEGIWPWVGRELCEMPTDGLHR